MFHGFYDEWMYHPLVVFDSRGFLAAVLFRPDKKTLAGGRSEGGSG